jgi:predicted component of type VI protein secretion system
MIVKLLVVHGKPTGRELLFGPGEHFLGRGPECQVRFNSDWVSRQHCVIVVADGMAKIRDLGSRNGTLLNGVLIREAASLSEGDKVQIGPVTFEVRFGSRADLSTAPQELDGPPGPGIDSTAQYPPAPG